MKNLKPTSTLLNCIRAPSTIWRRWQTRTTRSSTHSLSGTRICSSRILSTLKARKWSWLTSRFHKDSIQSIRAAGSFLNLKPSLTININPLTLSSKIKTIESQWEVWCLLEANNSITRSLLKNKARSEIKHLWRKSSKCQRIYVKN